MSTCVLNASLFANMVRGGALNLGANRSVVNDLNVFPIPDGDTGDNMFMTIDSGCSSWDSEKSDSLDLASRQIAKGMLMGARGNSGVILSRIFSGISKGFAGKTTADLHQVGLAFENGVQEAYGAVAVPVEGTILTVYKDAVGYANSKIDTGSSLETYFDDLTVELKRSLDRTPELLAVLKEAGVVDSGGAGFVFIAEGMKNVLNGNEVGEPSHPVNSTAKQLDFSKFTADTELTFGYCTEFLLRLQNRKCNPETFDLDGLIAWLNSIGDSVVCFQEDTVVKVHVHTKTPGNVLTYCQQFGEFLTLKIENMTLQHSEVTIQNRYVVPGVKKPHKAYGIVSVAAGKGIQDLFRSLGVDEIVDGGQSMNPSAEDFIRAFREINADTILVFPNNGNVILSAQQAASLYHDADVRVVKCKNIGEGYAAISMLDFSSGDTEQILNDAEDVISGVVTGAVSVASRDTEKDGVQIHKGDYIGFVGDRIYVSCASANEAAAELSEKLNAGSYDVVLLLRGKEASIPQAEELCSQLSAKFRRTEVILQDGDQPVFDYLLIFE